MGPFNKKDAESQEPRIGRPPKLEPGTELTNFVKGLGVIQCSHDEVAAALLVGRTTWFEFKKKHPEINEAFEMAREGAGKAGLRRKLWKMADKHAGVVIFLAKNYLGMTDSHEFSGPRGGPIPHADVTAAMTPKEAANAYARTLRP